MIVQVDDFGVCTEHFKSGFLKIRKRLNETEIATTYRPNVVRISGKL